MTSHLHEVRQSPADRAVMALYDRYLGALSDIEASDRLAALGGQGWVLYREDGRWSIFASDQEAFAALEALDGDLPGIVQSIPADLAPGPPTVSVEY